MKIDHIFHNLNPFGGAEEHITSLAVLQKAQGDDVNVCLIQAVTMQNQYAQRLKSAGVPICQWPVWLSRLSGDWDTRETILRYLIAWPSPLITIAVSLLKLLSNRPQHRLRESVEGRLRTFLGGFLDPNQERKLFLLLLTWRYYRRRPDVLHVHSYGAGLEFVLQWAFERNLPTIYQEHSTPDLTARRWYELPTNINMTRAVVAVSETSAQALRQLCGVTRPIQVIPPIATVDAPDPNMIKPLGHDGSMINILTIARLSREKGLNYLIEAAKQVIATNSNVRFVIYGEGYLRESLETQINLAHLGDQVCLAGSFGREELPGIMRTADIFVLPSITEGFPLSIVEAMALGVPSVATAVGGIPELIEDRVTGLLCPPQDANSLAQAILTLLKNPSLSNALAIAAQNKYSKSGLKPEHVVTRFTEVYSRAMQLS